jgi:hypothetical protein
MVSAEDLPDDSGHEGKHCFGATAKRVDGYEQEGRKENDLSRL